MTIDQQLVCYKRLPNWTATTLPEMVTQKHNTKVGTWAKLTILSGALNFYELLQSTSSRLKQKFLLSNHKLGIESLLLPMI